MKEETFSGLLQVLTRLSDDLPAAAGDAENPQTATLLLQLAAECFRAQRTSCVQNTRNQNLLRSSQIDGRILNSNPYDINIYCYCILSPGLLVLLESQLNF